MDLLETILRSAKGDKYVENFRAEQIDAQCLKILNAEDLVNIGVDDEEIRANIMRQAQNLMVPSEKKININVDSEYAEIVLLQIANQMKLHEANIFCAVNRVDVVNCDVKLKKATECALESLHKLQLELNQFRNKLTKSKSKKSKSIKLKQIILSSTIGCILISAVFLYRKIK